jgi:hypothetical protein
LSVTEPTLAERIGRHLDRLMAWVDDALPVLEALPGPLDGEQAPLLDTLRGQGAALDHLLREHEALRREWSAPGAVDRHSPEARAVAEQSVRAQARVAAWEAARQALVARAAAQQGQAQRALEGLGRDRALARRLRLEDPPRNLDRQA